MRECEFESTVSPLTVATVDLKKCVALLSYCNFNSSGACIGANECTVLMKYCQVCCYCQVVLESSFLFMRHFYNFPLLFLQIQSVGVGFLGRQCDANLSDCVIQSQLAVGVELLDGANAHVIVQYSSLIGQPVGLRQHPVSSSFYIAKNLGN